MTSEYNLYTAAELAKLKDYGTTVIDPQQTTISREVPLERIGQPGSVLFPGTRIWGERTYIGPHCVIGSTGPVSLRDACLTRNIRIASGHIESSLLLNGVSIGPNAFIRAGCLLEEQSSIAHTVGLKQTILFPYVTLGSLINLCDIFVSGGTSSKDHSEVGSSFIHFNFTPNGPRGDKATATLVGDVPYGVFLDQKRIFLGGQSGIVGPLEIGYGSVLAAGSVYRSDIAQDQLVLGGRPLPGKTKSRKLIVGSVPDTLLRKNIRYIGNLVALCVWYNSVRVSFWKELDSDTGTFVSAFANRLLNNAILERIKQVERLLERLPIRDKTHARWHTFRTTLAAKWLLSSDKVSQSETPLHKMLTSMCTSIGQVPTADYLAWVHDLDQSMVKDMRATLTGAVSAVEMLWDKVVSNETGDIVQ